MVAYGTQLLGNSIITAPLALAGAAAAPLITCQETGDAFPRLELLANGNILQGVGTAAPTGTIAPNAGGLNVSGPGAFAFKVLGSVDAGSAGFGLKAAEGANAKQGTFVLSGAATTVVPNTTVTANSRIFLSCQALGTVAAASTLAVSGTSVGVSFTVTPSQATDTSTIAYEIFEPG
jgi:hypothetical protein